MNAAILVVGGTRFEEPRHLIMLPTRIPNPFSENIDIAVHHVGGVLGSASQQILDLGAQLIGASLVGIQKENPIIGHVLHRPVLLSASAIVFALKKLDLFVSLRDFRCPIRGE